MKKIRKGILVLLICVLTIAMGAFAAACGKKKVKVSFDTDGAGSYASQTIEQGGQITLPTPTKDGFVFDGWYTSKDWSGDPLKDITTVNEDTTFYAKWSRGYMLTLDLDGGDYNGASESISFLVGQNKPLLQARWQGSALKDIGPVKNGLEFGAWFDENDQEITETSVMPARDYKIKAKYLVFYTIEIHKQTEPLSTEYEIDDSAYVTAQGYVNESLTVTAPTVEHFEFYPAHENNISTLSLTTDTSSNMFVLYYNRATYRVIYNANAPANTEVSGEMRDTTFIFSDDEDERGKVAKNKFEIEGYRLAGWSLSATGEIAFQSGDTLEYQNYNLYALWDKGYRDVLGGTDYIYFPRNYDGRVILLRAEHEIEGVRKTLNDDGSYSEDANGKYIDFGKNLYAKLDDANMNFAFFYGDRSGEYTYEVRYDDAEESDKRNATLTLDGYDGGTLVEDGQTKSITYYYDKETDRFMLNVSGEAEPRGFVFGLNADKKKVFTFLGDEFGEYLMFQRTGISAYAPLIYSIRFDGVGGSILCDADSGEPISSGVYFKPSTVGSGDVTTYPYVHSLIDGQHWEVYLTDFNVGGSTVPGAVLKDDAYAGVFTRTVDNKEEKLDLVGFNGFNGSAKYTKDGVETSYDCYVESSAVGPILHLLTGDPTRQQEEVEKFMLEGTYKPDGTLDKGTFRDYVKFTQYYYFFPVNAGTNSYNPAVSLVIYDEKQIEYKDTIPTYSQEKNEMVDTEYTLKGYDAEIYTPNGTVKGHVTDGVDGDRYTFYHLNPNPLRHFEAIIPDDATEDEKKAAKENHLYKGFYTSFEFNTLELNIGQSFFVYLGLDKYGSNFNYTVFDTEEKEGETPQRILLARNVLGCIRGSGFEGHSAYWYPGDGTCVEGSLEEISGDSKQIEAGIFDTSLFYAFYYGNDPSNLQVKYFGYYVDSSTSAHIEFMEGEPRFMARLKSSLRITGRLELFDSYVGMVFAGDGHTAYYYPTRAAYDICQYVKGTYTEISKTQLGATLYHFTPDDASESEFDFIHEQIPDSYGTGYADHFRLLDARWENYSQTLSDGASITLDGYGHYARYVAANGEVLEGNYFFGLDEDNKFTQFVIYEPHGSTITIQAGIITDEDGHFIELKLEERMDFYMLFASDYWFPAEFDQAIVVFDSKNGTFVMPEYGNWVWYVDWENGIINDNAWDYNEYFRTMFADGTYELIDEDERIFVLHCKMKKDGAYTGELRDITVKMEFNGNEGLCIIQDDAIVGSYVGPNNEVVYIDGYGLSFFVDEFGNRRDGVYTYVNQNENNPNFQYVAFDDGDVAYLMIFDQQNRTFEIGNKEEKFATFYSDEFDAVEFTQVFSVDGVAIGYWLFDPSDDNKFKIFAANFSSESGFLWNLTYDYQYPEGNEYVVDGKTYRRYVAGETFTLQGSIVFDAFYGKDRKPEKGEDKWTGMKLEFTPDGTNALNAPATLTYKHDGDEQVFTTYTVVKEQIDVLQQKTTSSIKLYRKYNPYGFRIDINLAKKDTDEGFLLHAAAVDGTWPDYAAENMNVINFANITYGSRYSIGAISWPVSDWGLAENEWIISVVFNAADKNGKILATDAIYSETFTDKGHVITQDKNLNPAGVNVYEVVFKASDGYNYSAWIEPLTYASGNQLTTGFLLFALNIKVTFDTYIGNLSDIKPDEEIKPPTSGDKVKVSVQQFECAYWGLLEYGSVYTIGIENEKGESLIDDESLGHWVDDLIILYKNKTQGDHDEPATPGEAETPYVVKVTRDENNIINGARIDKSEYKTFKGGDKVKMEEYTDEDGKVVTPTDTNEYDEWYFGFVKGYGHAGEAKDAMKDYLVCAAVFNKQTGKYVKVDFYGAVKMLDGDVYEFSYTLGGDTGTVLNCAVRVTKDKDGKITGVVMNQA